MIVPGFNVCKAAQVVAFFARANGGRINVLKLAKLLYLADREAMKQFDLPILFDFMVSMNHGPVNSMTLDLINGLEADSSAWRKFVGERVDHEISASGNIVEEDLDELSRKDIRLLDGIWNEFGFMSQYELRDYTHENCPEWENPHGSSSPIPYDRIFKFLGKPEPDALAANVKSEQDVRLIFERHSSEQESCLESN